MATRIPHVLESYLALPPECAQILLTSVLGASTNWLVLRYLYSHLRKPAASDEEASPAEDVRVVLVSFMRDFAFWKEGASRLGVDLEGLGRSGKFAFVDGLSSLFSQVKTAPGRPAVKGKRVLRSAKLPDVQRELDAAISDVSAAGARTILVLDQPDVLLAASSEDLDGLSLRNMLRDVQETDAPEQKVHATITAVAADEPLVAAQATTLEKEHASLVLGLAHAAEMVVGLRLLDTGNASDVSGVLRITAGGDAGSSGERVVEETELLYFVGGDGSVKVFGRGQ